jgi:MFS family permease
MNTFGFVTSFGLFQDYYTTILPQTASDISWIGSIQVFLLFFVGVFAGRLTDQGHFRLVLLTGSALQLLGVFTAANSTTYWQLFLSQGLTIGLGHGCIFCPVMATLSTYFSARRGLAIGLAASGGATGGMIFPSMVRQLLPSAGYAWAMRSIGFVMLFNLVVMNLVLRSRMPPRKAGSLIDWAAFREMEYVFYAIGVFLVRNSFSPLFPAPSDVQTSDTSPLSSASGPSTSQSTTSPHFPAPSWVLATPTASTCSSFSTALEVFPDDFFQASWPTELASSMFSSPWQSYLVFSSSAGWPWSTRAVCTPGPSFTGSQAAGSRASLPVL